jgi:polyisoprenoid-binding protein YceI
MLGPSEDRGLVPRWPTRKVISTPSSQEDPAMKATILPSLLALLVVPTASLAEAPVFNVAPAASTITFKVDASMKVQGRFQKWKSSLTFTSPDVSTGVLAIDVDAASVDTGDGMKNGVLKGSKFFDIKNNPDISFHSTKISQTGPNSFAVTGVFKIRGVSKPQTLTLTTTGRETGSGTIKGTMSFNRKDYGMNGGVPLVRIGDHVDVTVDLKVKRVSGPPVGSKT